jgi:hypothetical protein
MVGVNGAIWNRMAVALMQVWLANFQAERIYNRISTSELPAR